jgi:hypothetical protein
MGAILKLFILFPAFALMLGACQTTYEVGTAVYGPADVAAGEFPDNNASGYVPAADFLSEDFMKSDLHGVEAQAWNDGYANTYKIVTDDHVYIVQGTDNARKRVHEIAATEHLKKHSVAEEIGETILNRSANLVQTPLRAINIGRQKSSEVASMGDAVSVFQSGIGEVLKNLSGGIRELGVTSLRITRGVGGTRCASFGACVKKAGRDVWSGMDSITGKHEASRRVHQEVGTDPYTDNDVLQKQVDRIAYASAYTGQGFELTLTNAGLPFLSPYTRGVGYYNNIEFVAQYEDAEKRRNIEKAMLLNEWGADQDEIDRLYNNENFTHTTRTYLLQALEGISSPDARVEALADAAESQTRYVAESKVKIFHYLSLLDLAGDLDGYVEGSGGAIALKNDGTLILPFTGDYVSWTDDIEGLASSFSGLTGPDQQYTNAEIHILGLASPLFMEKAENYGIRLIEIN